MTDYDATTTYFHADQVGSGRMTSSVDGYPVWQATYLPFGYEYNAQEGANKFKFGTYQRDAESGLDYAEARFYNPQVNRFMTPDPAGTAAANPANPQSWNRYTYVMDNPVTGIDPSGLFMAGPSSGNPAGGVVLTGDDLDTYQQIGKRTVSHPWVRPPVKPPAKPPATQPATPPPSNVPSAPAPAPQPQPSTPPTPVQHSQPGDSQAPPSAPSAPENNGNQQSPTVPKPPNPILQYDNCVTQTVNPAKENANKVTVATGLTMLNTVGLCGLSGPDVGLCVATLGTLSSVNSMAFWIGGQTTIYDAESKCLQGR